MPALVISAMNLPKEYRISPINYVIQRRMTEAKWSLTNTELSQARSRRVGYENVDHFAKLFCAMSAVRPAITAGNLKTVLRNKKSYLNFLNQ